ncbi:hypothetical protein HCN44_007399 [Aphidius gifuensis]|uniref:Uncharacterized protein n=1 Tax=Aphidius gifuensis TaxID=684658 RepID=A0A835CN32_APHGI|nr:hypothetical protein HCN44_007399 [Aphidius gifuensis]
MKVTVFIIFLFVFSFDGLVFGHPITADKNVSDICETEACIHAASRILRSSNLNVNPCDDFYEFACGGYLNNTKPKNNIIGANYVNKLNDKFEENVEKIFKQDSKIDDFKYTKLAKTLYKACKACELDEFFELGRDWAIFKGSEWNESSFDFNKTIFKVGNTTQWKNYFFNFHVNHDYSSIIVKPDTSIFGDDVFIEDPNEEYLYKSMVKVATAIVKKMNISNYNTNYTQEIKKVINFELALSRSRLTKEQKLNSTFDRIEMTLDELTKNYSFFNWQEYISYYRGSPIDSSTKIVINNFSYMKKLNDLLNSTEIKTIANYVMWKHIDTNMIFFGYTPDKNKCFDFVLEYLPLAMGAIYIQNYDYSKMINSENNIENMILNIKEKIFEFIKKAEWIDNETKNKSIKKIQSAPDAAGYITKLTNNSIVDEFYKDLELFEDESILEAYARLDIFERKKMLTLNNETSWTRVASHMAESPAFFMFHVNAIAISYTILLNDIIYDSEKPYYMNYGSLGFLIGREITHAFEILGIKYDDNGPLNNDSSASILKKHFHEKLSCFVDQYGNYKTPGGKKVNGNISQRENIADNGGIRAAYQAYDNLSNTADKRLPGLFYTPRQMFWMSFANVRCEESTEKYMSSQMNNEYPPSKFRVLGTLSNMPEFAEDFNCPLGSNMNPTKKCSICTSSPWESKLLNLDINNLNTVNYSLVLLLAVIILNDVFEIFIFNNTWNFNNKKLYSHYQPSSTDNNNETCQTPACLEIASRLLHNMDPTVNPCHDFYQFTCGGFINSNYMTDEVDSFSVLKEQFLKNLEITLKKNSSVNEPKYLKLAITLYRLCNEESFRMYEDILIFLDRYGGWPVLKGSQWNKSDLNSQDILLKWHYFHHIAINLFKFDDFSISMEPLLFTLTVQDLAEGRNNTKVNKYYNKMIKTVKNMGVKHANYKDELDKILEFEIELSRGKISAQKKLNPTFDRVEMTLDELTKNYSFFDWQMIIDFTSHPQVNLSSTFTIINFSYLKKLSESLNSTEIKRILTNYMMWKYVENEKNTTGFPKDKDCVRDVIYNLPAAAATIYVQSYNNNSMMINARNDIIKMFFNIKEKFHRIIEEADWIDNHTKNKSLEKLNKLSRIEIGYIEVLTNTSKIDQYYENLQLFDNGSYSDALERTKQFLVNPLFINESYSVIVSMFAISYLLIPQNNYFYYKAPNYMNYGGLGFAIGHEMVHGFDVDNIHRNEKGTEDHSLWTEFSRNNFHNRSQCIIEQYGNYTMPEVGENVNGSAVQPETVSDNGGMKATYRAYEELSNSDKRLPGLDYSPRQLLWLSFGNAWCDKLSVDHIKKYINGTHPRNKFRVNGLVSNMPEFSKDFGCQPGSNMNPIKKCTVW